MIVMVSIIVVVLFVDRVFASKSVNLPNNICSLPGYCKTDIGINDNGKYLIYSVGDTFILTLDSGLFPKSNLNCLPGGVVVVTISNASISNFLSSDGTPYYSVKYEGVSAGTCVLRNGNFKAVIKISDNKIHNF
jgi:hypothetical protein